MLKSNECKNRKSKTTTLESGVTVCCGYDFGMDAYKKNKPKYCPMCGKQIIYS